MYHPVELPLQHRKGSLDWPNVFIYYICLVLVRDGEGKNTPCLSLGDTESSQYLAYR